MRWYGGFAGGGRTPFVPAGASPLWPGVSDVWLVGTWTARDILVAAETGDRQVALIGPTGATSLDVARAARTGLPDDATWRWPGAFTAVERVGDRLVLLTDPCAACPIYVLPLPDGQMWASSARALAALAGGAVNNDRLLTEIHPAEASDLPDDYGTFFAGVRQLPPGARITLRGGRSEIHDVWFPRPIDGDPTMRLREAIIGAVRARGNVTCDLSGGADSSALTVAAARVNADGVLAFTLHPAGVQAGGDLDHARAVVQSSPRIRHRLLPLTSSHLPYGDLDSLPATDEPAPSTIANAQLRYQLATIAESGSGAHLTGDGGDSVFRTPDEHLADLLRGLRLRRVIVEATALGRLRRVAPYGLLANAFRLAWRGQSAHQMDSQDDLATAAIAAEVRHVARSARADVQLAERVGVDLHNPLLDPAVVHAVVTSSLAQRAGRHQYKPQLYAAMRPWLPDSVRGRITKGSFHADYYLGLRRHIAEVTELLSGHAADLGLVDRTKMSTAARQAAAGLGTERIDRALRVEAWLRALHGSQPVSWHESDHALADVR